MKKLLLMALTALFLLTACIFDVPITLQHTIPIDTATLGTWEMVSEENDKPTRMKIFRFSATEYVVHYFEDDWELYFRAYPVKIGEISAIQLEAFGDDDKAVSEDAADRYLIADYHMLDGMLQIRTLNTELIDKDIATTEALQAAFLQHKDNPELFNDPGLFRRVTD